MPAADPHNFARYSVDARKANLRKANEKREAVANMRIGLKDGSIDPYQLVAGDGGELEPIARNIKLGKLLVMIPGIGEATRDEVLGELELSPNFKLIALTFERRAAIAEFLRAVLEPSSDPELPKT